jgi:putative oxidoreductase
LQGQRVTWEASSKTNPDARRACRAPISHVTAHHRSVRSTDVHDDFRPPRSQSDGRRPHAIASTLTTHVPHHLLRAAARILTGSTYILLGLDAARAPGARVDQAAHTLAILRTVVPLPDDDELIVRGNGAVQVLGGSLLMLGTFQRLSALALAGSLIPTTMAGHGFWAIEDPVARKAQRIQFHKNMAMIGGLLFAAIDKS